MSIGDYAPHVGEMFIFTPNPNDLNGLDSTILVHTGKVVSITEVESRAVTQFPFSVLLDEATVCLSPDELSFLMVTTTLEDWL